tara:strand:- start:1105 stop:1410 length:306 start_codon:yes stop_codon:yes gene_type:complete
MALIFPYLTKSGVECSEAYAIIREVTARKKSEGYEVEYYGAIFADKEAYKAGFRAVERFREYKFELELDSIHNILEQAYINLRSRSGFEYAEDDLKADEEE